MYEATADAISAALEAKAESKNKKRGAISVAQFKIISALVWTEQEGEVADVWNNHNDVE